MKLRNITSLFAAAMLTGLASVASAENPNSGHWETQTVYVQKVVTICNPYNSQLPVGQNDCHVNAGRNSNGGADFTGTASCTARSYTQMNTNCHNETITVPKQVTVWVQDGVDPNDPCSDPTHQSHHCGNGAGPGG